ncbi:hypothetical protein [Hymenobacter cellulosivorans]|uniref:T9SS type A sorting domain-containing protein n=1 Tax=Hymenobacter cellulosivorans TaxID=2932249 RepID=A0ABY4F8I2_9BACT|nr:hypothetical protein [Hymenobacter cellulosivorans]UOQ52759.1 hypothetical protein MUN80_23810 [Hymenobacter cellulosivorans]
MRRTFYSLFALLTLAAAPARAQVSPIITRTDMPAVTTQAPVDSLRLSLAAPMLPANAPPLSRRGANQTWNYAGLVATGQTVDRYVAVSATAPIYQLSFGAFAGPNRATVAAPEPLPVAATGLFPITDPYQFYAVSAATAAAQDYRSVGFGGTLAGFTVPVTYRTAAEQDIIYHFPLSYASAPDSCLSFFETPSAAASTGYLSRKRKRVNKVDAWGTLTTPFGTFPTIRVVSKLLDHDSIAVGNMPGLGFTVPVTREYKWLAKTHHVPLLTITTQEIGGTETVTAVQYRDVYRRLVLARTPPSAALAAVAAYPNPAASTEALLLRVPAGLLTLRATDLAGRLLFERQLMATEAPVVVPAAAFGAFRGSALLRIGTSQGTVVRRLVRQ